MKQQANQLNKKPDQRLGRSGEVRHCSRRREISGSCSLLGDAFSVQAKKRVASRPLRLGNLAAAKLGQCSNRNANRISDLRLGQSGFLDFGDDSVPVHDVSFSNSRILALQQVELQACDYSKKGESMSLAKRLKEAREDKVWKKVDLKKAAKLRSASTLTELENGDITESPQLPAIADALGVEIMWLKYGKGPKHRPAAKTVQLSEDALQIALAVNAKSPEYQRAILDLVTVDAIKDEGAALSETPILVEDNRLSSRSPEEQPDDQDRSLPAQHVTRPQK